jgi:hypothetical protein
MGTDYKYWASDLWTLKCVLKEKPEEKEEALFYLHKYTWNF